MVNPPPGSTAAIREALERMRRRIVIPPGYPDCAPSCPCQRCDLGRLEAALASLSPEAAPVPAAMPQIEVGDAVSFETTERVARVEPAGIMGDGNPHFPDEYRKPYPAYVVTDDHSCISEDETLAIERKGVVIWRRAEAPRP